MKRVIIAAMAALVSVACTKENIQESVITEVQATFAGETKTILDSGSGQVQWTPADRINVFFGTAGSRFTSTNEQNATIATFTGNLPIAVGSSNETSVPAYTWGLYPYNVAATCDGSSITTTLPDQQAAAPGTFADDLMISIARSQSYGLAFYNVCGGVRFKLSTEGVKSVTMKGASDEALAGTFSISFDDSGIPQVTGVNDPKTEVTVTCADGFATDTWYYIVTLPATFTNGLSFTLATDDKEAVKTIDREMSIRRAAFGSVSALDDGLVWRDRSGMPAPKQIFYTSSDEATIAFDNNFYNVNGDQLSIVSNVYADGRGVITFSSDVARVGERAFDNSEKLVSIILPEGVTSIGDLAFRNCSNLTSIVIPEGVTSFGAAVFSGCSNLTSINIPEGVTLIGAEAFFNCSSLTSIVIPEGVTSISRYTFCNCSSLASINIPNSLTSIGEYAFYNCSCLASIVIPESVTSIGSLAFRYCSSLASINIPEGVTSIENYTFDGCSSLASITIPEGVTSIGISAFRACSSLASINIPEGVTSIKDHTFDGCSSLASITIPNSVTSIGEDAFYNCSSLASIVIPEGVTSIEDYAFCNCSRLASITIPSGVTSIVDYTFYRCSSLASVTIPEGVTYIGNSAFRNCSSLTSIVIPRSVTLILPFAFCACSSLASINIPEGVTSIKERTFYGCSSLASITIPEGVTSIGYDAFYSCFNLKSFYCKPVTPPTLGGSVFYGVPATMYVPENSVDAYKAASGWSDYSSRIRGYNWN